MNSTSYNTKDYPAANGGVVTERVAKICVERGHAVWLVNGADSGTCPRCGGVDPLTQLSRFYSRLRPGWWLLSQPRERHRDDR